MRAPIWIRFFFAFSLLTVASCTKEAPGLGTGVSGGALIQGRVFDTQTNEPVKNAAVKTTNGQTVMTDDEGKFTITAQPGKVVLTVEEDNHAKGVKEVDAYADAESYVEMFAKGVSKDSSLDATVGGDVKVGEMTVTVPGDALKRADGSRYSGMITVETATVRPEKASDLSAFPGKFDGTTVDMQAGSVETRVSASLRLLDDQGEPLTLDDNATVEIFMPVRPSLSRRNTRMWRLREQSADWEEVGFSAVLDEDPINREPALRSAIRALTWWNAGEPFVKSRIRGCLLVPGMGGSDGEGGRAGGTSTAGAGGMSGIADAGAMPMAGSGASLAGAGGGASGVGGAGEDVPDPGVDAGVPRMQAPLIGDNPLAGIQVVATGIGYGYFAEKYTDDDGCFELEAKALGPVALYAQSRLLRSQAIRVLAPAAGMMRDIGMLPVGARNNSCPGVMEECGGRCVDTLTDNDHCGGCNNSCGGDIVEPSYPTLEPYHCVPVDNGEGGGVHGECGCDDEQQDCDGSCANIRVDNQHCGACYASCGAADIECLEGSCDGAVNGCEVGFIDCGGTCVPEAQGCGTVGEFVCGGTVCNPITEPQSVEYGYTQCCAPDGACGIATSDFGPPFAAPCASTQYDSPLTAVCPNETVEGFSSAVGCCRSDGQCGLVLGDSEDLGCILRTDVDRTLPRISCGADPTADAGIGMGGAGGTPGVDAGPAPDAGVRSDAAF